MKLLLTIALTIISTKAFAVCHGVYKVDKAAREAKVDYIELEAGVAQKFCLDMPKDAKARFVEFNSINLANAHCSDLRMTVNPPGIVAPKLHSMGSQPGAAGFYKPGRWVVKLVLKEGCNKFTLGARWY